MSVIEKAVLWAVNIANNNEHGYSQSVRWGPSYDCSSLVISAFKQAGLKLQSTYTGNMRDDFIANGFKAYNPPGNSYGTLKRGDVLLNVACHAALYIGNGQLVHARSSEGTSDTADNSGNEIRVQTYWNYPWDVVLRYEGEDNTSSVDENSAEEATTGGATQEETAKTYIPDNTTGRGVAALQGMLIYFGFYIGTFGRNRDGIDGDAGTATSLTNMAVTQAILDKKITEDELNALLKLN